MKLFYPFLLLYCISITSYAQKLPDVQTTSISAPTTTRIDGKNLEWNTFSAENKRTGLLYTIANDDKNLYLALKATSSETINKIFAGGISFSINAKGKKREEDASTITYPLVGRNNANRGGGGQGGTNRQRMGQGRADQSQEQKDSQLVAIKEIKVKGFNITDSLISIYNEYGIKAVAKMDEQKAYFCEIAIPLAALEVAVNDKKEIAYQIKLNGRQGGDFTQRSNSGAGGFGGGNNRGGFGGGNNNAAQQDLMVATDFWGKYIIQK
ncbi:hypothetical protein D3C87_429460 [compost metagenome]